jgi:RNA polymerase sigma-70 factor (ECF subfamily)
MFPDSVTPRDAVANTKQMETGLQENVAPRQSFVDLDRWMERYRLGEPVLPWVYAIARRVRIDGYRRTRRITMHEIAMEVLPERPARVEPGNSLPAFDTLVAALPEAQREVVTMLKVGGLSLDEVARATSSTVGAVKQKAHRAYEKLRKLLEIRPEGGLREEVNELP